MPANPKKRVKREEIEAVELKPDAWDQFEKAVDKIAPPKKPKPNPWKSGSAPTARKG
jgi:hypothetical protein